MDAATGHNASFPPVSLHSGGSESDINKSSISVTTSQDSESTGDIIARFELNLARICEKLTNLNLLSMLVETKESDFEAFVSDMDPDTVIKTVEYDLLSGFLDSEMRILETCMSDLQTEKDNVREFLYSRKQLGEPVIEMEDMLLDSEKSLEQSLEQVSEIKIRSANFEKNLLRFSGGMDGTELSKSSDPLEFDEKVKMKMESVEHPRHFLRLLAKSLKTEIDMDKRLSELTQNEETLTLRLKMLEQEVVYAEEESETTLEKFYEKDHASELLMEASKELLSEIKMLHFNLRGSIQREAELKNALLKLEERVVTKEKESSKGIVERENTIKDLREQVIEAENKVMSYEDECQELKDACEKVVLLEKELCDLKFRLQHAEACWEASVEEKSMYLSTIKDMSNVIDDLKKKVTWGETQVDSMEDRCILLSDANADLKKELKFVMGKVKSLETSLHQMEEIKKASAKDINLCSKFISDLVMQMKLERERLQEQISSLKQENKILVNCLKKTDKDPAGKVSHDDKASSDVFTTENKEALSTNFEVEKAFKETVTDSTEAARDIDARQLKTKDVLLLLLILIVPLIGLLLNQTLVR